MPSSPGRADRRAAASRHFATGIADLKSALDRLAEPHLDALFALTEAVSAAWRRGGKLLVCGNGGSAADSQHIVAELVGTYQIERDALPAVALTTDTSILTSVGNDKGIAEIFARQVIGIGRPGDVLLVISTSGNSENCVRAVAAARQRGLAVFGFLGGDGGKLVALVDQAVIAPCSTTPEIQEIHITLGHLLCRILDDFQAGEAAPDGSADD